MHIGIDTFACNGGNSAVGGYLAHLLRRFPTQGLWGELFGWEFDRYAFSEAAPDMEFVSRCRISGKTANTLWHLGAYPPFARARRYDCCFFPAAHRQVPSRSPCPAVGTVHDLAAYWGSRKTREHLGPIIRLLLPDALRRLDRIIAVSTWVKQELIDLVGVDESLVEVIPNGIDHEAFFPRDRNEARVLLIQPFSFSRPYILYVSRIEHPIKNHVRLIEAFGIFKARTRYPHRLVLAGAEARGAEWVRDAAVNSPYRNDIFFTGHFPTKSLPELYAGADMVAIPSMYEGFGMGVLEAMASGIPVACARAASLPEAAGHAALYFNPLDAEDIADRLVTLGEDRDLYAEKRRLGIARSACFSWDEAARRTWTLLDTLCRRASF